MTGEFNLRKPWRRVYIERRADRMVERMNWGKRIQVTLQTKLEAGSEIGLSLIHLTANRFGIKRSVVHVRCSADHVSGQQYQGDPPGPAAMATALRMADTG